MKITDEDVRRFQEIWREEFNEEVSEDFARQRISELDELYLFLYRRVSETTLGSDLDLSTGRDSSNFEEPEMSGLS